MQSRPESFSGSSESSEHIATPPLHNALPAFLSDKGNEKINFVNTGNTMTQLIEGQFQFKGNEGILRSISPSPPVQTVRTSVYPIIQRGHHEQHTSTAGTLSSMLPMVEPKGLSPSQIPIPLSPSSPPKTVILPNPITINEDQMRSSPFLQDLLDRLIRMELSVKPVTGLVQEIENLRGNVDYLLQKSQTFGPPSVSGGSSMDVPTGLFQRAIPGAPSIVSQSVLSTTLPTNANQAHESATQDFLRQLSLQVTSLSGSVASLLTAQAQAQVNQTQAQLQSSTALQPVQSTNSVLSNERKPAPMGRKDAVIPRLAKTSGRDLNPHVRRLDFFLKAQTHVDLKAPPMVPSMSRPPTNLGNQWESLGISHHLANMASEAGISTPTKMQAKAISWLMKDQDIICQSADLQERLICYLLPALTEVYRNADAISGIKVLIITATPEQAYHARQIIESLTKNTVQTHVSDGQKMRLEVAQELQILQSSPPQILIGTPQRLLDLLALRSLPLDTLKLLILDDMDQIFSRNLSDFVLSLIRLLPVTSTARSNGASGASGAFDPFGTTRSYPSGTVALDRQTAIFSSAVPEEVLKFAYSLHLREPVRVLTRKENTSNDGGMVSVRGIKHYFLYIAIAARDPATSRAWKLEVHF